MKKIGLICMAIVLLGSIPVSPAWANRGGHHGGHHGHGHHHYRGGYGGYGGYGMALGMGLLGYGLGSYFGGRAPYYGYGAGYGYPPAYGYGAGYGYAPAYGYAPPAVAVPVAPPVYIQQQEVVQVQPQAQAQASNYWHYCRNPEGYYPYIKNCPGGWLQVAPQPQ